MIVAAVLSLSVISVSAQQDAAEARVPLSGTAVALDSNHAAALEGALRTTALNGAPDMPVTNIRLVLKNVSGIPYSYVSGLVTFYDGAGVRCGEGLVKADVLAINEAVELAKMFGGENSSKFINGVLGTLYRASDKYVPDEAPEAETKNEPSAA